MKKTEEKVIRFIRDNYLITPGDKILIALSGGPDSVFLIHFFNKFSKKYKVTLGALHVNHMLRGKAASNDEQFCKRICEDLGIKFYSVRKNVAAFSRKNKMSIEEAGRTIRYSVLEKTARSQKYSKIATAHNSNDNTETVLLNLIKGTGLRGLSGIPLSRGNIIRPVLMVTREEIINYLNKNKIEFIIDESNASDDYERNFLRNKIIPEIKKRLNPSLEDTVSHTSHIMRQHYQQMKERVDQLLKSAIRKSASGLSIDAGIRSEGEAITAELVKAVLERNFSVQLSFKDVMAVSSLFLSKRGSRADLLSGLSVVRENNEVVILRTLINTFTSLTIGVNQSVKINGSSVYISEADKSSFTARKPGEEYITADDADDIFFIREWKKGDRFYPLGMRGSKKVSDYLNEKKIQTHLKQEALVLTNRDRIVWIIGLRLDNRFRITNNTKRVLKLCLK